jgi:hypothetical protein
MIHGDALGAFLVSFERSQKLISHPLNDEFSQSRNLLPLNEMNREQTAQFPEDYYLGIIAPTIFELGANGVLAGIVLRPLRFLRGVGLLLPDFDIRFARDGLFVFWLLFVCCADLNKFRLGGDLLVYVRIQLGGVASRVGALCGIWANCKSFLLAPRRHANQPNQCH